MKKIAVVLGVAAVATFTGCKDPDYVNRRGNATQDEPKSLETEPVKPVAATPEKPIAQEPVKPIEIKTEEVKTPAVETKPVAPVEAEYTVYVVQNGDFLAKISKKYNVTIGSIKRLNNLKDDKIRVGQKLKLPGKIDVGVQAAPVAAAPKAALKAAAKKGFTPYAGATKEYVVKNGDTLGSIAYGNGLNIRQLKQLNGLASDTLKIGQKLKIPAEKVARSDKSAVDKVSSATTVPVVAKSVPVTEPATKTDAAANQKSSAETKPVESAVSAPATPVETVASAAPVVSEVATTTYVVQEGEDLTRLAVDYGVTPTVLRELNNLGENDTIKPGQVLKVPADTQQ